jgi:purine nucleosidase
MDLGKWTRGLAVWCMAVGLASIAGAQAAPTVAHPEKIIFDTDIGDDLDDAFALGLALDSPELDVRGVTTAWGDTALRARLAQRLVCEVGRGDVPVYEGPMTPPTTVFTQARWASQYPAPEKPWPDAIGFMLDQIKRNPGQITLISVAPLHNVGALIERDSETFAKLKRVVIMGGSIRRGYADLGYGPLHGPDAEWNIKQDVAAAQKLFTSGVPIFVLPLDSTVLKLDETKRSLLFSKGTRISDALTLLYEQWSASTGSPTPTLFDAMAVAAAINPSVCPFTPMRIRVDDQGFTRVDQGEPKAQVCLRSSSDQFFEFLLPRLMTETAAKIKGSKCNY